MAKSPDSKEPHWLVKGTVLALIPILIAGLWWVASTLMKVPAIESQMAKQGDQLTEIKIQLVTLSQRTGQPLGKDDLKKILSSVADYGEWKAERIESAKVRLSSDKLPLAHWVPAQYAFASMSVPTDGATITDKKSIAKIITMSALAARPITWTVANKELIGIAAGAGEVVLEPKKKVTDEELASWAESLNAVNHKIFEVSDNQKKLK